MAAAAAAAAVKPQKYIGWVCSAVFGFLGWREGRTETAFLVKSVVKKCCEIVIDSSQFCFHSIWYCKLLSLLNVNCII